MQIIENTLHEKAVEIELFHLIHPARRSIIMIPRECSQIMAVVQTAITEKLCTGNIMH